MGHLPSMNQAKYQAKFARDVPTLGGSGEDDVLKNLSSLLRREKKKGSPQEVVQGSYNLTTLDAYRNRLPKLNCNQNPVVYCYMGKSTSSYFQLVQSLTK